MPAGVFGDTWRSGTTDRVGGRDKRTAHSGVHVSCPDVVTTPAGVRRCRRPEGDRVNEPPATFMAGPAAATLFRPGPP